MKKTVFKNKTYYFILIIYIGVLLVWNLFTTIAYSKLIGILPVIIQTVLLILIISEYQYAKIGIKIWAILFIIVAPGLKFVGQLLTNLGGVSNHQDAQVYLTNGITLLIGILIVIYTNKTVAVEEAEIA